MTVSATPTGGFTLSENRVLTFEAGATGSIGAVTVTAENDDVDTADKTVTVSGTVSNSAVANAPAAQTLTITDDDLPKVTIAAGTSPVTEGDQRGVRADPGRGDHGGADGGGGRHPVGNLHQDL